MRTARSCWVAALVAVVACSAANAREQAIDFNGASWVWRSFGAGVTLASFPASVTYFRVPLTLPAAAEVESASVAITCDNLWALYLNGHAVGECDVNNNAWGRPQHFDVARLLKPGRNVLAVEAVNTLPGPAGLLAKMVVRLKGGAELVLATDGSWKCSDQERLHWEQPSFDDSRWVPAQILGAFGAAPWGRVAIGAVQPAGAPIGKVHQAGKQVLARAAREGWTGPVVEVPVPADFAWPRAIVFVGDDCSLYRPSGPTGTAADSLSVTIFNPRKSRGFPEHDLPAPMKVGRRLYVLEPARPGVEPRPLVDAGKGALGSPSVSFDGASVLVSMALNDEPFFHIYRVPADGGPPRRLTTGPFHDIDPAELPDGRIVFTSTRIGTFEEYHNPPSRALFVMDGDGGQVRPLTHTIIFDNEPEVLADGRIIFIRSDNFFDRGKVETILHAIHPDGTNGTTEFGLHVGPEYGGRLRAFVCGSPAPMPDGRVAFLSSAGITVGHLGARSVSLEHFRMAAGDVAALPDGRLLATIGNTVPVELVSGGKKRVVQEFGYRRIGVIDPNTRPPQAVIIHETAEGELHSPVFLGARTRPPVIAEKVDPATDDRVDTTGVFYCQNVRYTKNTRAGWPHVRAVRVIAGKGLTTRSSHSYIVHAGNETIELGTVPLAPDGSFAVEVPANTPIAFQAVDAEGRSELNEMSWISVRPGERRGCVGCHNPRRAAPSGSGYTPLALRTEPLKLLGQGDPHRFRGNNAAVTGLMELQFDRYREVAGINRHGEVDDPLATGAQEVDALIRQLRGDDGEPSDDDEDEDEDEDEDVTAARISAAQRLAIFRDPTAAPALAECLQHGSREVRVAAAMALAVCGTRASVPTLLDALTDYDPLVGCAAAIAIENLTGHAEPFDAFGTEAARERQAASWSEWFAGTSWVAIERDLIARLDSGDRDVARRAAVALGHVGSAAVRPALRSYVTREREVNPFPAWRSGGRHRGDGARFDSLDAVNPRTLQAATRSLGYVRDEASVVMLAETIDRNDVAETANLFLAEAAVEALGRIGTPAAEDALVRAFAGLEDYPRYTYWYGDHEALMACHASPVHYFIIEALDAMGSTRAGGIVPHLIRSVPTDPDRALLLPSDDYETLTGRVIRRCGLEAQVVETCLAILGDKNATKAPKIEAAIRLTHRAWGGDPGPENRAAQTLSLVCRDREYEPRIRAAFERYSRQPTTIPRVFDKGIPVVLELPKKHWVCFYVARALGNLADERSTDTLIAAVRDEPTEAATGRPDPLGPGVLFLHNDLTPCWRAAAAWALGEIGSRRAVRPLLDVVADLENAVDTRHAAASALKRIADRSSLEPIRALAAEYPEVSTRRALLEACEALSPSSEDEG